MKTTFGILILLIVLNLFGCVGGGASTSSSPQTAATADTSTITAAVTATPTTTATTTPTATPVSTQELSLTSPAVANGELLPEFRCEQKVDGKEASIPLAWSNVPAGTASLAIVMTHYPDPADLTHPNCYLLLWGIDPSVTSIAHGMADSGPWYMGSNKDGTAISYTSPCSQSSGSHEYTITIYALSKTPSTLPTQSSLDVTWSVMMDAISTVTVLDKATLTFVSVTP